MITQQESLEFGDLFHGGGAGGIQPEIESSASLDCLFATVSGLGDKNAASFAFLSPFLLSHPIPMPYFSDAVKEHLLMPLAFFYESGGRPLPPIHFIDPQEMPEPQHFLLVHQSDMTPRLRNFHAGEIGLQVIQKQEVETFIMRLVLLQRKEGALPVEIGAIGIDLTGFEASVADLIRAGNIPLGGILEEQNIPHQSAPKAYFVVAADALLAELLQCEVATMLFGRCNVLSHPDGIHFADIVEILPP